MTFDRDEEADARLLLEAREEIAELRGRIVELERDLRTERTWREEYEGRGEARGTDG